MRGEEGGKESERGRGREGEGGEESQGRRVREVGMEYAGG